MKVSSIQFGEGGALMIEYADPADMKESGLMRQQALLIPPGLEELEELVDELDMQAERTLSRAIELLEASPAPQGEDDEPGYDNPMEREAVR